MIENCVLLYKKCSARAQCASGACYAPTAVERRSTLGAGDAQRKRASVQKSERLEENVEFFPKICIIWEDNA